MSAAPASGGPCLCVGCLHGHDGGTRMCPEPEWCECGECWGRALAMFDDQGRV